MIIDDEPVVVPQSFSQPQQSSLFKKTVKSSQNMTAASSSSNNEAIADKAIPLLYICEVKIKCLLNYESRHIMEVIHAAAKDANVTVNALEIIAQECNRIQRLEECQEALKFCIIRLQSTGKVQDQVRMGK